MFSSTCDSSDPVEVEPESNATTERSSSSETSSAAAPIEYEILDGDAQNVYYSNNTEDAVSNEKLEENERRTNFVVDSSWSPVVRVVNVAETGALGSTLTARVVRVVTETNDEMSVDCNRASSQNGIPVQKPLVSDSAPDAEHGAKKQQSSHVLNGSKQVRNVFSSSDTNEEHKNASITKTNDVPVAKRKAEIDKADKLASVKNERTETSKKQRKSLEAALAEQPAKPVETHKSGSSSASGTTVQEQAKKRPVEGSAFDQVYEMMKKKKQKLMVNAAAGNQAPAPTQTPTQAQIQAQKVDLKLEFKNDLKPVSKMDTEPSPTNASGGATTTVMGILTCSTAGIAKRRKQVRFRDENLVVLHTFDWIEDERINVSRPNFALVEGMFLRQHMAMDDALDDESTPGTPYAAPTSTSIASNASTGSSIAIPAKDPNWYRAPYPLDLPADFPRCMPGANSEERRTQIERERTVLAAIYFDKSSVPPSAAEPDRDSLYAAMTRQPCLIPLDDMSETHETAASGTTNGSNDSTAVVNGNADADADADTQSASEERHNMMQMLAALGEQLASLQQITEGPQLSRIRDVSGQVQGLQTRLARAAPGAEAGLIAEIARIVEPIRELCAQTALTPTTNTPSNTTNAPPSYSHASAPQRQRSWDAPRNSRWEEARNSPSYSHGHDMSPGQYSPSMDRDRRRPSSRWGPPVPSYPSQPHYSSRHYPGPPYGPHPYPPANSYGPPGPPHRPPYSSYSPPHHFGRAPPHSGGMYGPHGRFNDYPGEPYAPGYGPPMGNNRRPAFTPNGPHYDSGYSPRGSS